MSTRRRGLPPLNQSHAYTLLDEMAASPTEPLPASLREARIKDARFNLDELIHGLTPTSYNWKVLATVGNVLEVMLELKMIQDPGEALLAAQRTLRDAAEYALDHGVAPRLAGAEIEPIATLLNAYEEVLEALPHRDLIRVLRETEKRMRVRRPGDYDASPRKRKDRAK